MDRPDGKMASDTVLGKPARHLFFPNNSMNRLLYYLPSWEGGLADYGLHQINALTQVGVEVEVLTSGIFDVSQVRDFRVSRALLPATHRPASSRMVSRVRTVIRVLSNISTLADRIVEGGFRHVLMECSSEYLAPLWAGRLERLARRGVVFGSIVHDPVRDYHVGPAWWHRRSIAASYRFLREAFVHEPIELDTAIPMPQLRTTVIPHGPYEFPPASKTRAQMRSELKLPDGAVLLLSFGNIRDGKNLDLAIRALQASPSIHLLVAGREQSAGQRPIGYYKALAASLGVEGRCLWMHRFIPASEVSNLFEASDLILLTYTKEFRSASGVLNTAVRFRRPCLASGGGSNLRSVVEEYGLGVLVEPDDADALQEGLARALRQELSPRWVAYEADHSWKRNADIVCERMFGA